MKSGQLKKFDDLIIKEMKQKLEFAEEFLYELVRMYRKDKNMRALIDGLKLIVKARDEK